jgi:hypothetical protein
VCTVVCSAYAGALVASSVSCAVKAGADCAGSDLPNADYGPVADAAACCEACSKRVGCNAFVWHGETMNPPHECFLKTDCDRPAPSPNATAGACVSARAHVVCHMPVPVVPVVVIVVVAAWLSRPCCSSCARPRVVFHPARACSCVCADRAHTHTHTHTQESSRGRFPRFPKTRTATTGIQAHRHRHLCVRCHAFDRLWRIEHSRLQLSRGTWMRSVTTNERHLISRATSGHHACVATQP